MGVEVIKKLLRGVAEAVSSFVVGHEKDVELILIAILSCGHVLIYGPPGSAKTLTANLIAKYLGLTFKRIQFTPDILPTDIVGAKVIDPKTGELRTVKGPIFSHIVLADEINRGNPKALSALLEAMQEGTVSIEGDTYELPRPFSVIATLNPIETQGIFPLPVAVLDRFMISLRFEYPDVRGEEEVLLREEKLLALTTRDIPPAVSAEDVVRAMNELPKVRAVKDILKYVVSIVRKVREDPSVFAGPSPRASQHLLRVAKGLAVLDGRDYVVPDDVKEAAIPVLRHRLVLKESSGDLMTDLSRSESIVAKAVRSVEPPR